MKFTGDIRPIDDLGRIVLPKKLRKEMNIENKDLLAFFSDGTDIILKKVQKSCIFCNAQDDLIEYKDHAICKECLEDLMKKN